MASETSGTIAWINADDHTLTLVDNQNQVFEMRFLVGGDERIADMEVTLRDIVPGGHAVITYERGEHGFEVTAIDCRRAE